MRYELTVYRPGEGVSRLQVEAASAEAAGGSSEAQGFDVVAIRTVGRWNIFQRKERLFDLLLFSQELRALNDAGLSLIESLGALARKEAAGDKRRLIEAMIRRLREGKSFSGVLREFPAVFPPLYMALVAASEQTGDLGGALVRFIDYRSNMDAVRKRIVAASIYPALLVGVGGLVIVFLMTYVVPRFSRVYEEFGSNLPWMSRVLLQWGSAVDRHGLQILLGLVAIGIGLVVAVRRQHLSWRRLLGWALRREMLAGVQERYRSYALSRFYRTLGLLLQGGIPVVTALDMARELLDEDTRPVLDRALIEIRGGVALSDAMERGQLAPPVASDLLRIGEKTGDMGGKMIRIADFFDEETARWADWFTRLFEPLLMLTIGLFVAFIVVLLYMPIFELAGSVQ